MSDTIRPFKINVPQSAIDTLKEKLALTTFPEEVDFSDDWNYGVPRSDIKRLAEYWRDGFDWRAQEEKLNQFPHFTTDVAVDGFGDLQIHFVHQKSSKPDSIPLLFCHGCEYSRPKFTEAGANLFHRARKLSRSPQNPSPAHGIPRWAIVPCCSSIIAQFWVLGGCEKEGLQYPSVRGIVAQADGEAWV